MSRLASLPPKSATALRTCAGLNAALLALVFTACAPDTSKTRPTGDAFATQVLRECGTKHLGALSVSDLMNTVSPRYSAYFVQITARYGQGTMSWNDYVRAVVTVHGGGDGESAGLTCIKAQKP